ncbi:MAG: DUF4924 family protein [Bacteroidaceae bacterium]|nr:DUF4924 family protein [Bacteroidaceae bacterium]
MYISQQLRQKSIAEYLIYMWQMEDLIRAYKCSLQEIRRRYISQFDYDNDRKEELTDWFGSLITMMNQEGCRENGHLNINIEVMQELIALHNKLLADQNNPYYRAEYYRSLPYIVELRKRGANKKEHELETCFNALYGTMLLRLQKKEISKNTQTAMKEISNLIGTLAEYYYKEK